MTSPCLGRLQRHDPTRKSLCLRMQIQPHRPRHLVVPKGRFPATIARNGSVQRSSSDPPARGASVASYTNGGVARGRARQGRIDMALRLTWFAALTAALAVVATASA